jgi:hypothetical protein
VARTEVKIQFDFKKMDYITCNHKKSKPKIRVDVCGKCKRMRTCADYGGYIQPMLFPGLKKTRVRRKIRPIFRSRGDVPTVEDQMELDFKAWESSWE